MCLFPAGGTAVLQSDHHAATDDWVLQTAADKRRWGACVCSHPFVCLRFTGKLLARRLSLVRRRNHMIQSSTPFKNRSALSSWSVSGFTSGSLLLSQAVSLCNLWKNPRSFRLVTWRPAVQCGPCFLSSLRCHTRPRGGSTTLHLHQF